MTPVNFPESNATFGPPVGMTESQVHSIHAWKGQRTGGAIDGSQVVVVAWEPTDEERQTINGGGLIYLHCIGGLPPHYLSTKFEP